LFGTNEVVVVVVVVEDSDGADNFFNRFKISGSCLIAFPILAR